MSGAQATPPGWYPEPVRRTWSRRAALAAVPLALFLGVCAAAGGMGGPGAALAAIAPISSHAPTASATASAKAAAPGTAVAVLETLRVKGRAPMTGYVRTARFGAAWLDVDRNGCDTRDDVLRRDLTHLKASRCTVRSGVLADPYTGSTIRFVRGVGTSTAVQIDHVVALGDAWQTGAQQLTQAQRIDIANDPINLCAVDGPSNEQKSDSDAASWLPPNKAFRCTYVTHQIGVKKAYGLWVTSAEKAAMQRVLARCPAMKVPTSKVSKLVYTGAGASPAVVTSTKSATPSTAPSKSTGASTTDPGVVHPGSYCSPAGATGHTSAGTAMTCSSTSADSRARWRSAA